MADFVNTIDVLGDDAVIDSIIDRTIEEFYDDTVSKIGESAFLTCRNLRRVRTPNVTGSPLGAAFHGCHSLELLDFSGDLDDRDILRGCRSLRSIVLRKNSVGILFTESGITDTPITKGTGYIYVPRALIEDYKAATNWSTYATQFRALEDYTVDGTITGELDESKI